MLNQIKTLTPTNIKTWGAVGEPENNRSFKYISRDSFYSSPPHSIDEIHSNKSPVILDQCLQSLRQVDHLEKSILFIKQQNASIIAALHNEVDLLKRQNQELQMKISIVQSIPVPNAPENLSTKFDVQSEEKKLECLEREVERLRYVVREEQNKSASLRDLLHQARCKRRSDITLDNDSSCSGSGFVPRPPNFSRPQSQLQTPRLSPAKRLHDQRKFSLALVNRQIDGENDLEASDHILDELQHLITKQAQENHLQAIELLRIKEDLKEVLYTHKWTPETYLLTKSYVNSLEQKSKPPVRAAAASSVPTLPEISSNQKVNTVKNPPYMNINVILPNIHKQFNEKKT